MSIKATKNKRPLSMWQAYKQGRRQWNGYPLPGSGYSDGGFWKTPKLPLP